MRHWEEDDSGESLVGLEVRFLGSGLSSTTSWSCDMLVNLLLNLSFLISRTGK